MQRLLTEEAPERAKERETLEPWLSFFDYGEKQRKVGNPKYYNSSGSAKVRSIMVSCVGTGAKVCEAPK
jgi:hypothetical protein